MINLTKEILFTKSGKELESAIKEAITKAKECICKDLYNLKNISPSKITSSSRNEYYNASIIRLFDDHLNPSISPTYDESWVRKIHICTKQTPETSLAKEVLPKHAHEWLNKSSRERLSKDSILILHFLWHVGAVLLPLDMKKPTVGHPEKLNAKNYEFAAATYPEVLALVSKPFIPHVQYQNIPDIRNVMNPSAITNFEWYAWRLVRATDWYCIEDIDPSDISACADKLLLTRRGEADWFTYPIAPKVFFSYIQKLYPDRCKHANPNQEIKDDILASKHAIEKGQFHIHEEHMDCANSWLKYQDKFIAHQKSRGMKTYNSFIKPFGVLNTYLFSIFPSATGLKPPLPKEFNRKHIEGDNCEGFMKYLREGRSSRTIQNYLYKIESLFNYMAKHSSLELDLNGFVNPISEIDYPIVQRSSGTTKPAFKSEHFPLLLQYCYSIESFSTYLAEKVYCEQLDLYANKYRADIKSKNWNEAQKVIQTEKLGYVPLVFYKNPMFDPSLPVSDCNRRMEYEAVHLIPRFIIPIIEHSVENNGQWVFYPQLNYIRHNIVALETGIRSIHIRWLDKRTYDKNIDRSRKLDQICKLHVSTDKSNGAWDASVSKDVIEILDRQKSMQTWFNDPALDEAVWYDDHEDSPFGKIVTLFPKGGTPGTLSPESYAKYFKKLIFSFDLFCRYQLGIDGTNAMPEKLAGIESIDSPQDYLRAIALEKEACKLIEHTPHSCRVSVVSEYIRILPPNIIGGHITGHATDEHVMYYAKVDPAYLRSCAEYQKSAIEQGWLLDRPAFSQIKTEEISSKLQQAFKRNKEQSLVDFGAISFDRESKDEVLSGIIALKNRPLEALAFMPTHICPFANNCPTEIVNDLGAVPGDRMPCGGCYYSIKTVDHLPRILGHIRALTDECSELETHIAEAKKNGASQQSLTPKANHRKFLASEIISWSVTVHCLEQMHNEIKTRSSFLVEKPEIVTEQLEKIVTEDGSLANLIARTAEAKSHAEYFTPQLKQQIVLARNKLLAFTNDFNRLLQNAPKGFTLIDEFRGLIRSTCETLGLSLNELTVALDKPMALERPDTVLKLVSKVGGNSV